MLARFTPPCSRLFLGALAVLLTTAAARACNVPVFRFALESRKWTPDSLELTVFYREPFTSEALSNLNRMTRRTQGFLNLEIEAVDVTQPVAEDARAAWSAIARRPWPMSWRERVPLPRGVLGHARGNEDSLAAFDSALTEQTIAQMIDSPLRRDIARRILSGDSVVWVLLESGDASADQAAHKLLTARLAELEKAIVLPKLSEEDRQHIRSNIPLRVSFPVVRLSRTDPEEAVLIRLLLRLPKQPELAHVKGPIVFPFFGRGRVADALYGEELSSDGIEEMARYLTGACSCEVKEDNPGADLLFNVDWEAALLDDRQSPATSTTLPIADRSEDALGRIVLYAALGLLGAVVVGAVVLARRSRGAA